MPKQYAPKEVGEALLPIFKDLMKTIEKWIADFKEYEEGLNGK